MPESEGMVIMVEVKGMSGLKIQWSGKSFFSPTLLSYSFVLISPPFPSPCFLRSEYESPSNILKLFNFPTLQSFAIMKGGKEGNGNVIVDECRLFFRLEKWGEGEDRCKD